MATITANLTTLRDCDTTTGEDCAGTVATDTDTKKQGTGSLSVIVKSNAPTAGMTWTTVDLTGEHLRFWLLSTLGPFLNTEASNGLQAYVKDGSSGIAYWTIGGSDTYQGGWVNVVIDMDSTPDSGSFDKTDVIGAGIQYSFATSPKQIVNTWLDYFRYGDGLEAYGSTSFGIEEIYQDDLTNGYGIVEKVGGVYFLYGEIKIGDNTSTNATLFEDDGEVYVFANAPVSSTLYNITSIGNATGNTDIELANTVITSAGPTFTLDFDDATVEDVTISGCLISGAGDIFLDDMCTVSGSTFNGCGEIAVEAATFEDSTVSNSTATNAFIYPALVADDNTARITFTGNTNAVEISTDVDHTFDGHKFPTSSNTADINNTSGQSIIVYATNGSTASTSTGSTVDIQNSVTLTLTGIVQNSEVRIMRAGTQTVEAGIEDVPVSGEFGYTFNSPPSGFTEVDIFINKPGYVWYPIYAYTLPTASGSLPIQQIVDRVDDN